MESRIDSQLVMDYTQEILMIFDKNGTILEANKSAERELGYEAGELIGESLLIVFPAITGCRREGDSAYFTKKERLNTNAYRKNKTCFAVEFRTAKIDVENEIFLITAMNVSERNSAIRGLERAKDESEQVVRIRNEFVANVTHELRTPLNGILGHTKNLLAEEERKEQRKTLELIEHCCEDMKKIINNILDFSKLESGKYMLQEKEFKVAEMMDSVVEMYLEKINEKGLQLKIMIDDNVPESVVGDEQKLVQILNNLLSNAVKFTSEGKIVVEVIQTLRLKDSIELFFLVIDSGIGIKETDKEKIFQSFSQADGSITRKYGGTGLGLTVCKELVELMQGSIHVESEEGKGSMFSFSVLVKLPDWHKAEDLGREKSIQLIKSNALLFAEEDSSDYVYQYGTKENQTELKEELDKMVLCMDLGNWEKAEQFAIRIKKLVQGGGEEIRRAAFRIEMAARKADGEKAMAAYQQIEECFAAEGGGR